MNAEQIAERIVLSARGKKRHLVAIAGPPGSGKSTLAAAINTQLLARNEKSKIVPLDGFHFDNAVLSTKGLLSRKGAPQTFDATGFFALINRLTSAEENIEIPVFDRDKDLVVAGGAVVPKSDRILLVEGNYLLIKETPWSDLQKFWDQTIFINPGLEILQERLITRWLGHGLSRDQARERALSNDIPNAKYVLENSYMAPFQLQ